MASSLFRLVGRIAGTISLSGNLMVGCVARISTLPASDYRIIRCPNSTSPSIRSPHCTSPSIRSPCCTSPSIRSPYSTSPSKRSSPWLFLPPAFEGGDMFYKFYSLADNKVISLSKRGGGDGGESPPDDCTVVGSSHGLLALFNRHNCDLFLSNPISRRHIKLPPIHTLPIREANLRYGRGCVWKVIISCSPDEEECRAMMSFGTVQRLAFCCPGRSTEWTPIGEPRWYFSEDRSAPRLYKDFVYSSRDKLFFSITDFFEIEAWNLMDPRSPVSVPTYNVYSGDVDEEFPYTARSEEELELKKLCRQLSYLVVSDEGELFWVIRHVCESLDRHGSYVEDNFQCELEASEHVLYETCYPYKTIGFDVHKYDPKEDELKYMDGSLGGLVFFVGDNHSFARRAVEFPELKPNSIYFTDTCEINPPVSASFGHLYGGHDMGVFHYKSGAFSSCYYPCDVRSIKRIDPQPIWFTPNAPLVA